MAFIDIYPFKWHWLDKNNLRFYTCFFHSVKLLKPCYYWKVKNHLGQPTESSVFQLIPASEVVPFFFMQQVNRLLTPFISCIPSVLYKCNENSIFELLYLSNGIKSRNRNRKFNMSKFLLEKSWIDFFYSKSRFRFLMFLYSFNLFGYTLVCFFVESKSNVLFCLKCLTFIDIARQYFQLIVTIHFNCKIQIIFGSLPRQCASLCVCYCSIQFK